MPPKGSTALESGDLAKAQGERQKAKAEKLARAQAKKAKEEKEQAKLKNGGKGGKKGKDDVPSELLAVMAHEGKKRKKKKKPTAKAAAPNEENKTKEVEKQAEEEAKTKAKSKVKAEAEENAKAEAEAKAKKRKETKAIDREEKAKTDREAQLVGHLTKRKDGSARCEDTEVEFALTSILKCATANSRQESVLSMSNKMVANSGQCAAYIISTLQDVLRGTGQEAKLGKLGALELLQALCLASSKMDGNTAFRTSLEKELLSVCHTEKKVQFRATVVGQIVQMLGRGSKDVKAATTAATIATLSTLPLAKVRHILPQLTALMDDEENEWQAKLAAVQVVTGLATQSQSSPSSTGTHANNHNHLESMLPILIPSVVELLRSTKREVSSAAATGLRALVDLVTHPETIKIKGELIAAIEDPAKTEDTLEHLMAMTFVNALESPALALIVPVIARALTEGKGALTQKAAAACGSMCALAKTTAELKPFVSALMPGLLRSCEHSRPDVRDAAEAARKLLEDGIAAEKGSVGGGRVQRGTDYLVCLEGVILAFASRVLLSQTNLLLERGRRYAVLGNNGVGKTTLLNRLAAKDISNFPMHVKTHYITHEIPANEVSVTCEEYMRKAMDGDSKKSDVEKEAAVQDALDHVGFSLDPITKTPLRKMPITELSGGWRMKLTVARSMLHPIDLLLLDEPTNHLDRAALNWLEHYLVDEVGRTDTAICLVTHDYDFLEKVVTDVMHICDKKLGFYPCGFSEFQKQRPDVVAGLPGVDASKVAAKGLETFRSNNSTDAKHGQAASVSGAVAPPTAPAAGDDDNFDKDNLNEYEIDAIRERRREQKNAEALEKTQRAQNGKLVLPMNFPDPGKLEGVKSVRKAVVTFKDVAFQYPSASTPQLQGVNAKLSLNSRVVVVGRNGAGKTTLMKLLVGETEPMEGVGEITRHHNLRVSYIAQHSMHHIEDSLDKTPLEYLRYRFFQGQDRELQKMNVLKLTEEEEAIMERRGEVCEVVSRVQRGKEMWYELLKKHKTVPKHTSMMEIKTMHPYVLKLVRNFDEKAKVIASGMDIRPLTTSELRAHLGEFGIDSHLADQKIVGMSGGQKSRLILAAAMWTKPHMIALDEPTNYLDNDTLAALTRELKNFHGAVITVSHHEAFIAALCTEKWEVAGGKLETVTQLAKSKNDLPEFVADIQKK